MYVTLSCSLHCRVSYIVVYVTRLHTLHCHVSYVVVYVTRSYTLHCHVCYIVVYVTLSCMLHCRVRCTVVYVTLSCTLSRSSISRVRYNPRYCPINLVFIVYRIKIKLESLTLPIIRDIYNVDTRKSARVIVRESSLSVGTIVTVEAGFFDD